MARAQTGPRRETAGGVRVGEPRVAVVLGGAGKIGGAVARAMLREGAHVVVPSRSPERLARLAQAAGADGRLVTLEADVGDENGAQAVLAQVLDRFGAYDSVVVSLGSYWRGQLAIETPLAVWRERLHENFLTHVIAARVFLPPLLERQGATYIAINGMAADAPRPGSALIPITGVAQEMLVRQLAAEHRGAAVRILTVMLGPIRSVESDPAMHEQHPEFVTADEVGEFVALVASERCRMVHDTLIRLPYRPATTA